MTEILGISPKPPSESRAVIVGLEKYAMHTLRGPVPEALEVARTLRDLDVNPARIDLWLAPADQKTKQLADASGFAWREFSDQEFIDFLRDDLADDPLGGTLYLHWCGHGLAQGDKHHLLLPSSRDIELQSLELGVLSNHLVDMRHASFGHLVFVIDTCRESIEAWGQVPMVPRNLGVQGRANGPVHCTLFVCAEGQTTTYSDKGSANGQTLREILAQSPRGQWPDFARALSAAGSRAQLPNGHLASPYVHATDWFGRPLKWSREPLPTESVSALDPPEAPGSAKDVGPTIQLKPAIGSPAVPAVAWRPQPGIPYVSTFYVPRKFENRVTEVLATGGSVTIYGPEQFGKTWFARRTMELMPQAYWVELDLGDCRDADFSKYLQCVASQFCSSLEDQLPQEAIASERPSHQIEQIWERKGGGKGKFEEVVRGYGLAVIRNTIVLCRHVDGILPTERGHTALDQPVADLLLDLLNGWIQDPDLPRFLFTISTTADRIMKVLGHSSPFARTTELHLDDLGVPEMHELARMYGLAVDSRAMEVLMRWIGGHPYLAALALDRVRAGGIAVTDIEADWFARYTDHLKRHLGAAPALRRAMQQVCVGQRSILDEGVANQLRRIGLVVGVQGALAPRNHLYKSLWKT